DYLSVKRNVEQRLAGGSVRDGSEMIILAGVDVGKLSDERVESLRSSLERLWPEVDQVMRRIVQGTYHDRGTLVQIDLLREWVDRLDPKRSLPVATDTPCGKGTRIWRVVFLLSLLAVAG